MAPIKMIELNTKFDHIYSKKLTNNYSFNKAGNIIASFSKTNFLPKETLKPFI